MAQDSKRDSEVTANEVYADEALAPGGTGKQGDQQQMGQEREPRRDKHKSEGGSDKCHPDEEASS